MWTSERNALGLGLSLESELILLRPQVHAMVSVLSLCVQSWVSNGLGDWILETFLNQDGLDPLDYNYHV